MPTFSVSKSAAKAVKCDVLAVPLFEGLKLGPGAKEAQDALGTTVKELTEHVPVAGKPSKQFTGELGDAILVQTLGKLPAKQVLFVGMGPEKEASVGACEAQLQAGDRVLFFPSCFGGACPASPAPLAVEAPPSANVGEAVPVTVRRYSATGEASPAAGASVTGAAAPVSTDAGGHATLTFTSAGQITVRVSAPESVRTETTVCVHAGNDGTCGAPATTA